MCSSTIPGFYSFLALETGAVPSVLAPGSMSTCRQCHMGRMYVSVILQPLSSEFQPRCRKAFHDFWVIGLTKLTEAAQNIGTRLHMQLQMRILRPNPQLFSLCDRFHAPLMAPDLYLRPGAYFLEG